MSQQLSSKEFDCLYWAAIGKTSDEIGQILNISGRTVNSHVQNSCFKLDANNRQAAITSLFFPIVFDHILNTERRCFFLQRHQRYLKYHNLLDTSLLLPLPYSYHRRNEGF